MKNKACKFEKPRWCDYSAQTGGERIRVAAIAGEIQSILDTFATDGEIRQEVVGAYGQENPSCVSISGKLMDGFCAACRKVVAASGATDIRPEKIK